MHLKNRFDVGEFAVLAELTPPKGIDMSQMVGVADKIQGKVAAVVVPDMTAAVMRMSALGAAIILQHQGLETVMQVCCRDRNRLALQADLLAAYSGGVTNVMVANGEEITFGDHHQAKAVDDINRQELMHVIQTLSQGRDMAGADLSGAPDFFYGSTVNIGLKGAEMEAELSRVQSEIEAGAGFFITTAVFDPETILSFSRHFDIRMTNFIPTVMLLKSVGMARYIQRNMDHIQMPGELITRFQKAVDKPKESIRMAREIIEALKESGFKGVMISSMGWEEKLAELLE